MRDAADDQVIRADHVAELHGVLGDEIRTLGQFLFGEDLVDVLPVDDRKFSEIDQFVGQNVGERFSRIEVCREHRVDAVRLNRHHGHRRIGKRRRRSQQRETSEHRNHDTNAEMSHHAVLHWKRKSITPGLLGSFRRPGYYPATTSGVSCSSERSVTSAKARASGVGGKCWFGIAITLIPAARPERMPFAESSTTAQRSGATPSSFAARTWV